MPIKISRILHAGYVFESAGTQIAFDPIFENPFSRNCYAFPNIEFDLAQIKKIKFAAVFISHFHDDHCSLESLDHLDRETPIYIYCLFEEIFDWLKALGFKNVQALKLDQAVQVGGFQVTPRRALDAEVDSLFQIEAAGLNILNVVDSWIDDDTLKQLSRAKPWDMILWPFQTMREIEVIAPSRALAAPPELPPEWITQLQELAPRYLVPSSCQFMQESWSWYNHSFFPISYAHFQTEIEVALPATPVIRLNPGTSIRLDTKSLESSPGLSWIQPLGDQDVDYEYRIGLKPPPTSEIARHFPALSAEQMQRVHTYCHTGLVQKYNSMESPLDPYFEKPRCWRLSVFDHLGVASDFHYVITPDGLCPSDANGALAWTTEVPAAKLYAALELGESLTSMYMRINDRVFDPEIEKQIQGVDIVDDPLIRCLFNGAFGAYQKAQLERIKARNQKAIPEK